MLEGKVALITGSSRGIGNAIANLFLKEKAKVVICASKEESSMKAKEKFISLGYNKEDIMAIGIDMNKNLEFEDIVKKVIEKFGKIDILVNNAGITSNKSFLEMKKEDFINMFNVNFFGGVELTRIVANYMKDKGGSIIFTSSMVGLNGGANQADYASSKAAINGLVISLAKELGKYNIRVNAVAPGVVGTDMMRKFVDEKTKQILIGMTPLKRMSTPDDLAGAYLYLASDSASFTTGTIIKVDGGLMM